MIRNPGIRPQGEVFLYTGEKGGRKAKGATHSAEKTAEQVGRWAWAGLSLLLSRVVCSPVVSVGLPSAYHLRCALWCERGGRRGQR